MYGMSRGVLNNNPGNIRLSHQTFEGEMSSKDAEFKQFDTAIMGIRACAKIISNYHRLYGLSTVKEIINRWAPPAENDAGSYVADVCKHLSVGSDVPLDFGKPEMLASLVTAIIWHENGSCPYNLQEILDGVELALGEPNPLVEDRSRNLVG